MHALYFYVKEKRIWQKRKRRIYNMLRFGMPALIELDRLEETIELSKKLNINFIELNMNLPQFQIECLENTEYIRSYF